MLFEAIGSWRLAARQFQAAGELDKAELLYLKAKDFSAAAIIMYQRAKYDDCYFTMKDHGLKNLVLCRCDSRVTALQF